VRDWLRPHLVRPFDLKKRARQHNRSRGSHGVARGQCYASERRLGGSIACPVSAGVTTFEIGRKARLAMRQGV